MSKAGDNRDGMVCDLSIDHDGHALTATYFVEHGIIHARVGARLYRLPKGDIPAAETVRNLLVGLHSDSERRARHLGNWRMEADA